MNDGKGKGRSSNPEHSDLPPSEIKAPSSSILDRVTASATGLAHNAFAPPTSDEVSNAASAALTSTGKGRERGGRGGSWAESSGVNKQIGQSSAQGASLPSIRTLYGEEHIRDAETEFSAFLDGIDPFTPSPEPYNHAQRFSGQGLNKLSEHAIRREDSSSDQGREVLYNTVEEQQRHDGDAVLSILSHSSTNIDELQSLPVEEEAVHWDLTEQQILQLQKIMSGISSSPDEHVNISAEHPLNLIPNMVSIHTTSTSTPVVNTPLEEGYMLFGQNLPPDTARQIWMDQWEGVLTRYADEVWGNLLPLVVEAREDIKAMKDENPSATIDQSQALRRLRMVLDHVRKL